MSIHLVTTTPDVDLCRTCHHIVLVGYAEGVRARVDPRPLARDGQIAAILDRREIHALTRTGLVHIDSQRAKGTRIHGPRLAQHRCGFIYPPHFYETNVKTEIAALEGIPY